MKNKEKLLLKTSIILLITILVALLFNTEVFQEIKNSDVTSLTERFDNLGTIGYFIFIFIVILEVVFIGIIPSIFLYATAGIIFGGVLGATLIWIGNVLGASICFYLSRNYLQKYFEKRIPKAKLKKYNSYAYKYGHYAIFLLRLNPLTSSDAFSYLSGVTKMKFLPFIVGTSIGLMPLIIASVYLGNRFLAQSQTLTIVFGLGALIYVLFTIYIFKKK